MSAVVVAWINKRRERVDPFAQAQLLIDQFQEERTADREDRKADREDRARLETKIDKLYGIVGSWRTYGIKWELWHADGMPSPPGPPKRPELIS